MSEQAKVVEMGTFRLKPGVDPQAFVRSASALQGPLKAQPGFIGRTLARDPANGRWVDILLWRDMAAAKAAMEAIHAVPACAPFMEQIDPAGDEMLHLETVPLD